MYLFFDQRAVGTLANEENTHGSGRAGEVTYIWEAHPSLNISLDDLYKFSVEAI